MFQRNKDCPFSKFECFEQKHVFKKINLTLVLTNMIDALGWMAM